MQSRGILSSLTLCILGAGPAESRVGRRDRRGMLWFFGPAVGREIVQRGQRGNGSAFLTMLAPTLLLSPCPSFPPLPSPPFTAAFLFPPFLSSSLLFSPPLSVCPPLAEEGRRSLFSWASPKLFSLTFLRYFAVKKIFGHISPQ